MLLVRNNLIIKGGKKMTIIKWKNNPGIFNLLDEMDRNVFPEYGRQAAYAPKTNILETEKSFIIEIAVPGLKKEEINLMVEKNLITVSHQKKEAEKQTDSEILRQEFVVDAFSRSFTIPEKVDSDKIGARCENGVLTITLPKRDADKAQLSKSIKIS
jgi:HSP20 family protein